MNSLFDTMKKAPAWLSPRRGVVGYENQREIRTAIRPNASFQKLTLGLTISGGQYRKKTPPVYMEAR